MQKKHVGNSNEDTIIKGADECERETHCNEAPTIFLKWKFFTKLNIQ